MLNAIPRQLFYILTIFILVVFELSPSPAGAETKKVILKSGATISGDVVKKTDELIVIRQFDMNLTFYNDEIQAVVDDMSPPAETPKSAGQTREDALLELRSAYESFEVRMNETVLNVNRLLSEENNEAALPFIMDQLKDVQDTLAEVSRLPAPTPEAKNFQNLLIRYFNNELSLQTAMLQFLTGQSANDSVIESKKAASDGLNTEIETALKSFYPPQADMKSSAVSVPAEKEAVEQYLQELRQQNEIIFNDTKKLLEVNQKLQKETAQLIEENRALKDELVRTLKFTVDRLDQGQKAELLQYLNEK